MRRTSGFVLSGLMMVCGCAGPKPAPQSPASPPVDTRAIEAMEPGKDAAHLAQQYELLGQSPPPYRGPAGDERALNAYYKDEFGPWLRPRIAKGRALDEQAVKLPEATRPTATHAAALYYFGLMDTLRALPVPKSFEDKELGDAYVGSLEDTLAPLKRNARNAAFVALEGYEKLGELRPEVTGPLFDRMATTAGGARIRSLRQELVVPTEARECSAAPGPCRLPQQMLGALTHAMTYWSGAKYDEVLRLGADSEQPLAQFYVALADALGHGPRTLRQYFDAGNPTELELRHVDALMQFASRGGDYAGAAWYDAAMLRVLSPPARPKAEYFEDAAAMFRKAAVADPDLRDKSRAAEAQAKALAQAVSSVLSP